MSSLVRMVKSLTEQG